MAKNRKSKPEEVLNNFDPAIEKLAVERLLSGKQLFDYQTHRLRRNIRDEAQARAILLRAQDLAKQMDKRLTLRYFEKRLLKRAFEDEIKPLLAFLVACCLLAFSADETCDGIPDLFEFYEQNLYDSSAYNFEISDSVNSNRKYFLSTFLYETRTFLYEIRTNLYETHTLHCTITDR